MRCASLPPPPLHQTYTGIGHPPLASMLPVLIPNSPSPRREAGLYHQVEDALMRSHSKDLS